MKGNGELSNLGEIGGEGETDTCRVEMFWVYSFFVFSFHAKLDVAGGEGGGKNVGIGIGIGIPSSILVFQLFLLFFIFGFTLSLSLSTPLIRCVCILWRVGLWSGWLRLDGFRIRSNYLGTFKRDLA